MTKKLIYILISTLSAAFMNPVKAEPYFGANIGSLGVTVSKKINYNETTENIFSNYRGFTGQLFAGFNFYSLDTGIFYQPVDKAAKCQKLFFAIEFNANYNTGEATSSVNPWFLNTNASVSESQTINFDLFLLGKYRSQSSSNLVWFLGPGISRGKFEVSSSQTGGNLGFSGDKSSWLMGWSLKAGLEVPFTHALQMVGTYQLTVFNSTTISGTEPLTGENVSTRYRPIVNLLTIGISFNNWTNLFNKTDSILEDTTTRTHVYVIKEQKCMGISCNKKAIEIYKPEIVVRKVKVVEKQKVIPVQAQTRVVKRRSTYADAFPPGPLAENDIFMYPQADPSEFDRNDELIFPQQD